MVAGYMVPEDLPVWILLPNSQGLFWWDAMIRWLAVDFFIQIPIDIAFNMQQRLPHWYYITIQVGSPVYCHLLAVSHHCPDGHQHHPSSCAHCVCPQSRFMLC
jgi:hypothetical protein